MLKDKITLNIAEAVKKVLNTEGRIDDLRDNKRVRDDTDWYHDKPEKKERKKETSNVKTHVGKYGKSNFKSMSEDMDELEESASVIEKKLMDMALKREGIKRHSDHTSSTHKGDFVVKDRGAIVGRLKKGSWEHVVPEKHKHIFVKEDIDELKENEQIDELSKKTLSNYIHKADDNVRSLAKKTMVGGSAEQKRNFYDRMDAKIDKRLNNMSKAAKMLAKEDSAFSNNLEILSKQGLKGIFEALYSISEETKELLENSSEFIGVLESIDSIRQIKNHLSENTILSKSIREELKQKINDHRKHLERAGFDFKESIDFDDIDFDKLLECVLEVLREESDNEQFTKELETAKKKDKGDLRNDENIAKGKVDAVKVEEDLDEGISTPDKHQKRIALDTIRNPNKSLLGGMSVKDAEDVLRRKHGYTDDKIKKLKNEETELNDVNILEEMSDEQMKKREELVKGMKKNFPSFKERYGKRAKDVLYATATKQAMKE